MENDSYNLLLEQAAGSYKSSAMNYGAGAFAQISGGIINYMALNTEAAQYKLQAKSIEVQALERANQVREEFVGAVADYQYSAAARGISVSSGSVQDNIRTSSINLGQDMRKLQKSAELRAEAARTMGKISKIRATSQLISNVASGMSGLSSASNYYEISGKLGGRNG